MNYSHLLLLTTINLFRFLISCSDPHIPKPVQLVYEKLPREIDFNQDIKPILSDKCFMCHGPDKAKVKATLQLHLPKYAYSKLEGSGKYAIKPGNLNQSELIHRILSKDPSLVMPQPESHLKLSDYEKALLIKWIKQGAEYKEHWSFIPPKSPKIPKVKLDEKVVNPIDNFILARLETEKLQPNPKAKLEILLRRLSPVSYTHLTLPTTPYV